MVIGSGIIGLLTDWELSRDGLRVLLCEKGVQSGWNWGWLRHQGRDLAELPIMMDAMRRWHDMPQGLCTAIGFRQSGVTCLARDAPRMPDIKGGRIFGTGERMLSDWAGGPVRNLSDLWTCRFDPIPVCLSAGTTRSLP
ncbi:FAD-dependent oxidoreductase [Pseudogemmobacter sp. W21_MBD1_M6]|uniref:FAD-dependent oxidoreductase n=1 Tax=Pseudogemmobacter sp. W21_MBD1_M6 TaxID=3240271 RepID=UPI003F9BEC98